MRRTLGLSRTRSLDLVTLVSAVVFLAGCSDTDTLEAIALNDPTGDFYARPYPSDDRLHPDGTIDLTGYTRGLADQVDEYFDDMDGKIKGYGTQAAIYFRFSAPIDSTTLPDKVNDTLLATASVMIVDVTTGSPTYGMQRPFTTRFTEAAGDYIGPNWLALSPALGVPLREKTTYAAIVTDRVRGKNGGAIGASPATTAALATTGSATFAPLRAWLATQPALTGHVVNATVFTTQDATGIMHKLRAATYAHAAAPVVGNLAFDDKASANKPYNLYTGTYDSPNFQEGLPPYQETGGSIVDDTDGLPKVQRVENLRFALTVPTGEPPPEGWPVILYAHGTGGSYKSFVNDGSAAAAADVKSSGQVTIERFAMISIDQVLHGARKGDDSVSTNLAFFNLFNLHAILDNPKQGAADDFQLLRLVKGMNEIGPTTNQTLKFNPKKIYFKGHSQGGLTGPLFVSAEPEINAAIFSGAGGNTIQALLNKTEPPPPIPAALSIFLNGAIDQYHPVLNLVQAAFESSDPSNYGRLYFQEPPSGFAPKPIFQSMGITDHYTPVPTIKVLAMAMGVQPIEPMLEPIEGLELVDLHWGTAPTELNVAGGAATGVVLQYPAAPNQDGHFVIFDIEAAVKQSNRFLATHSKSGVATLTAP